MADGSCNNGAQNGVIELEAMRKGCLSWHPCQVSLCSRGLCLVVQYEDNCEEEIIADKQEVLARVRVRSTPLQGDDCSSLQQGDPVLATQNSHAMSAYYDARVEKATRVRHSKRTHCRCSFTIKWVNQALAKEALTVPANAIMKLATESINLHPTISIFLSLLESSNGLDTLPGSTVVDSMDWEMDISVLLEKQIKEISNSTDVSREKIPKNFVFGLEVDLKARSQGMTFDSSLKDPCITIPLLNDNASEKKKPMATGIEIPPVSISSVRKFTGSRSPLNPLAARAALASLRSNFSRMELPVQSNEEKQDVTNEQNAGKLLCGSKYCRLSTVDCSSSSDEFTLKMSATSGDKCSNLGSIVKTLFPTSSAPQIVEFSNVSSMVQVNGIEKENVSSEKKASYTSEMRLTRAQSRRNNRLHEYTQTTNTKETQLRSSKTRRVTRSTVNSEEKIETTEYNPAVGENVQTKSIRLDTSAQNTIAPQNCLPDKRTLATSPVDDKTRICHAGIDKSFAGEDGVIVVYSQTGAFGKDAEKHNYPKRLTRSAAREEAEKNKEQPKLKLSRSNNSESNGMDFAVKQEDGETFTHVKAKPNIPERSGSSKCRESKSASSQQQKRFSPRLRILHQTRS